MSSSHFLRAVRIVGGQAVMARILGVSPAYVSHVCTGRRPLAAKHDIPIERATRGDVTRYQLHPEIHGTQEGEAA